MQKFYSSYTFDVYRVFLYFKRFMYVIYIYIEMVYIKGKCFAFVFLKNTHIALQRRPLVICTQIYFRLTT